MTIHQSSARVFLAYDPKDESLLQQLETHLSLLKQQGLISTWDTRQIIPGTNRAEAINKQFEQASIILLLLSADFFASSYYGQIDMKRLLERHDAGLVRVIPITVRPCYWGSVPFAHLQSLPHDGRAITTWSNRDQAWGDVVEGIREAIQDLRLGSVSVHQPRQAVSRSKPELPQSRLQVDVCVVCALVEEAQAFLGVVEEYHHLAWTNEVNPSGYEYRLATIANEQGEPLCIHVSWLSRYGSQEMLLHLNKVIEEYQPRLTVMTGICAGDRRHTNLGDLVVAERTFASDTGKISKDEQGQIVHEHDTMTYHIHENTLNFLRSFDLWKPRVATLPRPVSKRQQRDWLLERLDSELTGSVKAIPQAELKVHAPAWRELVHILQQGPAPMLLPSLVLQDKAMIEQLRYGLVPFPFQDPPDIQCHISPLASEDAVRSDNPFKDIQVPVRGALAIDMEGAAFGRVMERFPGIEWLIVKGVSDYADQEKDDAYHKYSALASAAYALCFLEMYVTRERFPSSRDDHHTSRDGPVRVWNVPYPRNPVFTGREEILGQLSVTLETGQTTALAQLQAISGLGGIGKTQIAIEYAYRHAHDYEVVLWARAENTEVLTSSYTAIATLLNLPGSLVNKQEITIEAVKTWLQTHSNWLLILDNADDLDLLLPFLPSAPGGHILLTTRAQSTGKLARRLDVETLDQDIGALLLLRRAGSLSPDASLLSASPTDLSLARAITLELGGLPLALDQAGAYIEETASGLADYQRLYQTHRMTLLAARRDLVSDHSEPVVTTWSLSFQRVEQKNLAAADLLRLCAYLSPDAIPEEIITRGASHLGTSLTLVGADPYLLNQAIEALRAYSLLSRDPRTHTLAVHRLVQAVLRENIEAPEAKIWKQRTVQAVAAASPDVEDVTQWDVCERWIPHALVCVLWMEEEQMISPETASMLDTAGQYLSIRTRYREAESLYHRALAIREQKLGADHPSTAESLNRLGAFYSSQSGYALAEFFYQRALAIREQKLGPDHPAVAESLNSLGMLYSHLDFVNSSGPNILSHLYRLQDKLPFAKSLYQRTLARIYPDQEKFARAEPLYQRALAIREQKLGPDHPATAESLNNLAFYYWNRGDFTHVEALYQRALAIREQKLGPDHPATAESLNNLGLFYHSQVKRKAFPKAELLYQRALGIGERKLGTGHPFILLPLSNLAFLYMQQGKFEKAEPVFRRILAIAEQQLEPNDPSMQELRKTYTSYIKRPARIIGLGRDMWAGLRGRSQHSDAEPFSEPDRAINDEVKGLEGLDTAESLELLALRYYNEGKYAEAEPFFQHALAVKEQTLGPEHTDTLQSLDFLAFLYEQQEKYQDAEPLYQRILAINEQNLGSTHPETMKSLNKLAGLYAYQGDYIRAIAVYDQIISFDSTDALSYNKRGDAYLMQGDFVHALADYDHAISLNPTFARSYNNRGDTYLMQGDAVHALIDYNHAISLDSTNAIFYSDRGRAYFAQKDYARALADYNHAISLDSTNAVFYSDRGRIYFAQKDYLQALTEDSHAISLDLTNAAFYNNRGHVYYAQGDYVHAIDDYGYAISLDSTNAVFYFNRGNAYDHQNDSAHAIADFTQVIVLDPKYAPAYNNRGFVYYFQKDYALAIADFTQAIVLNPRYVDAYNGRSYAYNNQGDYAQAIADLDQLLLLEPDNVLAYYNNRGFVYYTQGDYPRAIADYTQVVSLDSKHASAYNYRGISYDYQQDFARAIADYTQAISLEPENARFYSNRGYAYSSQQDYPLALADFDRAIVLNPRYADAYNGRGNVYRDQGEYSRAIAEYTYALSIDPDKAFLYRNRGYAYSLQGDYPLALAELDRAIQLDAKDATAYYRRGHAHSELHAYLQALADYEQAISLDPNDATIHYRRGRSDLAQHEYRQTLADLDRALGLDPHAATASRLRQMLIDKFGL